MLKTDREFKLTVINLNAELNSSVITLALFNLLRISDKRKVHLINAYFNNGFVKEDADDMTCFVIHFNIPYLNKIKCSYCGRCITYCSRGARELIREVPCVTLDKHKCQGCLKCARSCTVNAITTQEIEVGSVFKTVIDNGSSIQSGTHKFGENYDVHIFKEMNEGVDELESIIYEVPYQSASISRKAITYSDVIFVTLPHYSNLDDEMLAILYFIHKINKQIILLKKTNTDNSFKIPDFMHNAEILYYNELPTPKEEENLNKSFTKILNKPLATKVKEVKNISTD